MGSNVNWHNGKPCKAHNHLNCISLTVSWMIANRKPPVQSIFTASFRNHSVNSLPSFYSQTSFHNKTLLHINLYYTFVNLTSFCYCFSKVLFLRILTVTSFEHSCSTALSHEAVSIGLRNPFEPEADISSKYHKPLAVEADLGQGDQFPLTKHQVEGVSSCLLPKA